MANLVMAVSPTNLLRLTDVVIYRNFCCHFKARLDYEGDRPCIQIQGERYSLVNSAAVEERGGEREQPRDLEQAQHGQKHMGSNNKQMSTFGRQFRELGCIDMSNSVQRGESFGTKEREIAMAAAQPGKINVSGTFSAPGCDLTLQTTQLNNIYLADLAKSDTREKVYKMPQLDNREVDMQRNTAVALD